VLFLVLIISNSCSGGAGTSDTHAAKEQSTTTKGIELIPLYKTQIDVFNKISADPNNDVEIILNDLYQPIKRLLSDCFGYSDSGYVNAQKYIYNNRMDEVESAEAYFSSINFSGLPEEHEETFASKTGQKAAGKFYFSFFEKRICNFCGCNKDTMQMDLLLQENQNLKFLEILLPHELNHNAFEISQNDTLMQETVLYKAIDEGFANLVS